MTPQVSDARSVKRKTLYHIEDAERLNDFIVSEHGCKALAAFVGDRHWGEFIEWYEGIFGILPPGVESEDAYLCVPMGGR